jgi:hypothetical protein
MDILEILKYTVPAFIVFLTAFFVLRMYLGNESKKHQINLILKNKELVTPLRLQAYERVTIFLERISPESLIMRVNKENMTCMELHRELLVNIRMEYEHNLSQQLYISNNSWEMVKNARSNLIKLINTSAAEVHPKAPAIELSKTILESIIDASKSPTADAIETLRKEVQRLF